MSNTGPDDNHPRDEGGQSAADLPITDSHLKLERVNRDLPHVSRNVFLPGMTVPFSIRSNYLGQLAGDPSVEPVELESDCPFPDRKVFSVLQDPVLSVTWGPTTRIQGDHVASAFAAKAVAASLAKSETPSTQPSAQQVPVEVQDRPNLRRVSSNRPPPPTPPDPAMHDQLSMPTLPNLHHNSIPSLIEKYRRERASDPEAFDDYTHAIKYRLMLAKLERGGSHDLLRNEYTAELASRLDAAAAERWSEIRQHEQQDYIDSEDEDQHQHHEQMVTLTPSSVPCERLAYQSTSSAPAASDRGGEHAVKPLPTKSFSTVTISGSMNQDSNRHLENIKISDHVARVTTSGNIRYQTKQIREISDGGEKRTMKTWIEIVQVVNVAGETELTWPAYFKTTKEMKKDDGSELGKNVKGDNDTEAKAKGISASSGPSSSASQTTVPARPIHCLNHNCADCRQHLTFIRKAIKSAKQHANVPLTKNVSISSNENDGQKDNPESESESESEPDVDPEIVPQRMQESVRLAYEEQKRRLRRQAHRESMLKKFEPWFTSVGSQARQRTQFDAVDEMVQSDKDTAIDMIRAIVDVDGVEDEFKEHLNQVIAEVKAMPADSPDSADDAQEE